METPELQTAVLPTQAFWDNLQKSYDVEHRHHQRLAKLQQQSVSFAALQFQSQMLGLLALTEAARPLSTDEDAGDTTSTVIAGRPADPT